MVEDPSSSWRRAKAAQSEFDRRRAAGAEQARAYPPQPGNVNGPSTALLSCNSPPSLKKPPQQAPPPFMHLPLRF